MTAAPAPTAAGVDTFTLDTTSGTYLLTQSRIHYLQASDQAGGRLYAARYAGSPVADVHRTLLDGGIQLYPPPRGWSHGEQAAAAVRGRAHGLHRRTGRRRASTGRDRIMTIMPTTHHQRVPLLVGSPEEVALAGDYVAGRRR